MNLLVVGASGFIGRHILAEARRFGACAIGTQSSERRPGLVRFDLARDRAFEHMQPLADG